MIVLERHPLLGEKARSIWHYKVANPCQCYFRKLKSLSILLQKTQILVNITSENLNPCQFYFRKLKSTSKLLQNSPRRRTASDRKSSNWCHCQTLWKDPKSSSSRFSGKYLETFYKMMIGSIVNIMLSLAKVADVLGFSSNEI